MSSSSLSSSSNDISGDEFDSLKQAKTALEQAREEIEAVARHPKCRIGTAIQMKAAEEDDYEEAEIEFDEEEEKQNGRFDDEDVDPKRRDKPALAMTQPLKHQRRYLRPTLSIMRDIDRRLASEEIKHGRANINKLPIIKVYLPKYTKEIQVQPRDEDNIEWIKSLYELARHATYGDVRECKTKQDEVVRKGRDLDSEKGDFHVDDDEFTEMIADQWCRLLPEATKHKVEAKLYKLNLYQPGDHFASHTDTPTKKMIGTVVVGLCNTSLEQCFEVDYHYRYHLTTGEIVAFYCDCEHEAKKFEKGYRATLTFKIFKKKSTLPHRYYVEREQWQLQMLFEELNERITKDKVKHFGFILKHKYVPDEEEWKGADRNMIEMVKRILQPKNHKVVPVVVQVHTIKPYDEESTCEAYVSHASRINRDYVMKRSPTADEPPLGGEAMDIPFYDLTTGADMFIFEHRETEAAEYTGNESRDGDEFALYLQYALVMSFDRN